MPTQESTIRENLLFREGDPVDQEKLDESERILRREMIFRSVDFSSSTRATGDIDLKIHTKDVWTTSVLAGYGHAGGKDFYEMGILEHNLFGRDKTAGAFWRHDIDRTVKGVNYNDPHVLGTEGTFSGGYGKDEKGVDWEIRLERPFVSRWAGFSYGASFFSSDDEDRLFNDGEESALFQHLEQKSRVFAAASLSDEPHRTQHVHLALENNSDEFSHMRFIREVAQLENRDVNPLLIGYKTDGQRFFKRRGINTFDRWVDLNRTWVWSIEAGPSLKSFGSTRDGGVGRTELSKAWPLGLDATCTAFASLNGRYEKDQVHNGVLHAHSQLTLPDWFRDNTLDFRALVILGRNLDGENEFLLGGENGLRAYSVRQFSGNKKALLSLENRQVFVYDWLNLVTLGWAVFVESGGTANTGDALSTNDLRHDVGVGFRFTPTRSVDPGLIRADLAYALNDNNHSSRWAINISGDVHFGEADIRKFNQ